MKKVLAAQNWSDYNPVVGQLINAMRFKLLAVSILTLFLVGGAFAAIVIEKQSRQLPYVEVVDCQGIHSFVFRGPKGTSRKPILVPPQDRDHGITFMATSRQITRTLIVSVLPRPGG